MKRVLLYRVSFLDKQAKAPQPLAGLLRLPDSPERGKKRVISAIVEKSQNPKESEK